ncbi:MAG: 2-oxoacid:ferredoxin oxidoreductase subunit beta, partial [Nitrospinales bacterium]
HNEKDEDATYSFILSHMMDNPELPAPVGIFRSIEKECYEDAMAQQIDGAREKFGAPDLQALLETGDTWEVK